MLRPLLFALLSTAVFASCHHDKEQPAPDPKPTEVDPATIPLAEYDVLAKAAGYWKWNLTVAGWGGRLDSSTVGYARRVVFRRDSTVAIYHNNTLVATQPFSTFTGTSRCNCFVARKMIEYANEPGIPNDTRRILNITQGSAYTQLSVNGQCACVDAPSYEGFTWVPKR